jgi:hypothetical protein
MTTARRPDDSGIVAASDRGIKREASPARQDDRASVMTRDEIIRTFSALGIGSRAGLASHHHVEKTDDQIDLRSGSPGCGICIRN